MFGAETTKIPSGFKTRPISCSSFAGSSTCSRTCQRVTASNVDASNRAESSVPRTTAPAGDYTYTGRVGAYPSTVWDEDAFGFTIVP